MAMVEILHTQMIKLARCTERLQDNCGRIIPCGQAEMEEQDKFAGDAPSRIVIWLG